MYLRGSQHVHGFFSEDEKQEYVGIGYSSPEAAIISNIDPEGVKSTMVVVKWSEKAEGYGDNIDPPLCGGLYKEDDDSLVTWSGTDPNAKIN